MVVACAALGCDPPPAASPVASATTSEAPRSRTEAGRAVPLLAPPGVSAAPAPPDDRCPDTAHYDRRPEAPCIAADRSVIWTPPLTFEVDKARLRPEAIAIVDDVAALLSRHPDIRLEIQGHANHGDDAGAYARRLDADRADAVMRRLVERGVAGERLTSKGYGDSVPVYPSASEEGKKYNRRIVFRVTSATELEAER